MKEDYSHRFAVFARKVGLCGVNGEHPAVVSVIPDPDNKSAQIVTVQGGGLSLPLPVALDQEVQRLQHHLGGIVYDLSFGDDTTQARFGVLPKKGEPYENL